MTDGNWSIPGYSHTPPYSYTLPLLTVWDIDCHWGQVLCISQWESSKHNVGCGPSERTSTLGISPTRKPGWIARGWRDTYSCFKMQWFPRYGMLESIQEMIIIDCYTRRSKKGDIAHSMGPQEGTRGQTNDRENREVVRKCLSLASLGRNKQSWEK